MVDLMAMDIEKALQLQGLMAQSANDIDVDAQSLVEPLAEAEVLLESPVPDLARQARGIAEQMRDNAEDLDSRARLVLAGGPDMNKALGAIDHIRENFTLIESRGDPSRADGILSRRDLRWAEQSTEPEVAAAAKWLLDNGEYFDMVETARDNDNYLNRVGEGKFGFDEGDRDGHMSLDDIDACVEKSHTWSTVLPYIAAIDDVKGSGELDGFVSRQDFELFLLEYNLPDDVVNAIHEVLDDRAYHRGKSWLGLGTLVDAVSFLPVIGDIVDGARAIYYVIHGDYANAAIFAIGLVPLPGMSSTGVRGAKKRWTRCMTPPNTQARKLLRRRGRN